MSHPFQRGVGDRDESSKKGVSQGRGGGLHQSQPRGGGGGQIMLMWGRSGYLTTHCPPDTGFESPGGMRSIPLPFGHGGSPKY